MESLYLYASERIAFLMPLNLVILLVVFYPLKLVLSKIVNSQQFRIFITFLVAVSIGTYLNVNGSSPVKPIDNVEIGIFLVLSLIGLYIVYLPLMLLLGIYRNQSKKLNKEARATFNGEVDIKLNNEYQIPTRDNHDFPGLNRYLELVDIAWESEMNADETAMYIAVLLYCGFIKHEDFVKGENLLSRIEQISAFGLSKGLIGDARWDKFSQAIKEAKPNS
jgi:hypothetical protein